MVQLTADECRVLGVLVEKAQTVPASYPMTLNSIVVGCNQKNNREPVANLDEDRVLIALDRLRDRGLTREVMLSGSRVAKYRHVAREALTVNTEELVLLTELLLRGPQSLGELRTRASRMHALGSIEEVENILRGLMERPEPMVRLLSPGAGERAARYAQLLCPDLHPLDFRPTTSGATPVGPANPPLDGDLAGRLETLEGEIESLKHALRSLAARLGEADPLAG